MSTQTWKALVYQNVTHWLNWMPKPGDYWVQFEVYTSDGRRGDIRTHAISTKRPVRRALLLAETSTPAVPIGDVNNMYLLNESSTFYGEKFSMNVLFPDKTKTQIIEKIRTTFVNTTENDISYLYFTCHAGGSIDKNSEEWEDFVNGFMRVFDAEEKDGELETERFAVLCSSRKNESSLGGSNVSLATKYWLKGSGWDWESGNTTSLLADKNGDNKVTLEELYQYSYNEVKNASNDGQHIVCSTNGTNLVLYGRY